jgi:beta-glucosidase
MYESFGSDTNNVTALGRAFLEGTDDPSLATAKHYMGAGSMIWGTSVNKDYGIDQGDTRITEATMRRVHLPPFKAAVEAA